MKYDLHDIGYYYTTKPDTVFKQTWVTVSSEALKNNVFKAAPQVGEVWYYKVKDIVPLGCGKVTDVTPATVEVGGLQNWSHHVRYKKSEIEFVEKRT